MLQAFHQELANILLNYQIGRAVLRSMCVGVSVWLGWSGIRVAGFSSGACEYSVELQHWSYCSWFDVLEFRCGWVGMVSVLQAFHQELATILLNYHIGTCPDWSWGPPSLLYNGYRVFLGGKEGPGPDHDPSPPSRAVVKK